MTDELQRIKDAAKKAKEEIQQKAIEVAYETQKRVK